MHARLLDVLHHAADHGLAGAIGRKVRDDVDVHLIKVPAGKYNMYATPDPDDDIAVVFYNIDGSLLAENNSGGAGEIEGSQVTAGGDPLYAVVLNVGNSNGSYKFNVDPL